MRHRASLARLAGLAAASLLLTHASPAAAQSAAPAGAAPAGSIVAPLFARPGLNFIFELESDVLDPQASKRSLDRLSAFELGMISRSTDGLFEVFHRDGSATIDLQGRFQEFSFVRVGTDGRLVFSCMDEYAGVREALMAPPRAATIWEER